ncbi:MAG: gliding motility-associated C-terminal domain-containing protein [Ferruginibacter sp.]|nr:gliding motility-associated C-terminal domain-containing protein [Cytophagales bacterium]
MPCRNPALLLLAFLLPYSLVRAQTYPFARLTGTPTMNTRGWNLVGDARIGDTNGDANALSDEMILCNLGFFNSGACFYNQPVNISQCQKWTAEFDYRIYDGTGADGIAFCFLANPPTGFVPGGNIGIPSRPRGLMVLLDTYLNCPGTTPVPKLEIRSADGSVQYGSGTEGILECPSPPQPTSGTLPELRRSTYNRLRITYDSGNIRVFVNNQLRLSGFYRIGFSGYFGFTSSTGGFNDRHSIRDFTLYTFKPIVAPPDAGADQFVCSGDSIQIGVPPRPNDPYTYSWNPTNGLNNANIPNPKVRLFNSTRAPVTYTYFVTKDSLANDTLCAFSEAVNVTVYGKAAQAGFDFSLCSGSPQTIQAFEQAGYAYAWSPATGLSNPRTARPEIRIVNSTDAPVTLRYVLSATSPTEVCPAYDTLNVTILPAVARAGPDVAFCTGERRPLGSAPLPGYQYTWSPATGLSDPNSANPTVTLTNPTGGPQTFRYAVTANTRTGGCLGTDTVEVTVLPPLAQPALVGPRSVCPDVTGVVYRVDRPQAGVGYQWTVEGGILRGGQGSDRVEIDWGPATPVARVSVSTTNAAGCVGSTGRLTARIDPALLPEKPFSPGHADTLCLSQATGIRYQIANATGSVYTWGVSGNGVLVNGQGTNGITVDWQRPGTGQVWVSERSTTRTYACSGLSDTLSVLVHPVPTPKPVEGAADACAFSTQGYRLDGERGSTYQWRAEGGAVVRTSGNAATVLWGAAGAGNVLVTETNAFGCAGAGLSFPVTLHPVPQPWVVAADSVICPQRAVGRTYQVAGFAGSRFSWTITNGQITGSNADSSAIAVNWNTTNLPIRLRVVETSARGCSGASLDLTPLYDATILLFESVSTRLEEEKDVVLRFRFKNAPARPNAFAVSRRTRLPSPGAWAAVGTVSSRDTLYTDPGLATDDHAYEYRIEGKNFCDVPLAAVPHSSVRLVGRGDEPTETVLLAWNDYVGWTDGVKSYEVWRQLDEEPGLTPYQTLDSNEFTLSRTNARDGFRHCYRIRAVENGGLGSVSWSNEVCLTFEHALFIPNVITPNGDGKNDAWVIENLELYPDHELTMVNRFGKDVFRTRAYRQDWNGQGLSGGVYYYFLKTGRRNGMVRGWVQVLR